MFVLELDIARILVRLTENNIDHHVSQHIHFQEISIQQVHRSYTSNAAEKKPTRSNIQQR